MGVRVALGVAASLVVIAGATAWHDLATARAELCWARATLNRLASRAGDLSDREERATGRRRIETAIGHIGSARRAVDRSWSLSLFGLVPGLSRQRRGVVVLLDDARGSARAGERLLTRADALASRTRFRNGTVPLDGLTELEGDVREAGRAIALRDRPHVGLWGQLGQARADFNAMARAHADRLLHAADAMRAGRAFAGAEGDRRYFVALQNNAEMRDGGMVLSYAVIRFDHGELTFERRGQITDLVVDRPVDVALSPGSAEVFGPLRPTSLWQSVNATADFAWSGRAMAQMYQQATGEAVDGVIGIDVPGLARVLRVVGPIAVPGLAEPISADNAARLLLHDLYEGLPPASDQTVRREVLSHVVEALIERLRQGDHDAVALGRELGEVAAGGHLRLGSFARLEQRTFEQLGLGGSPASVSPSRTFHLAVENRTSTKLDYYVAPTVSQRVRVTAKGTAIVRTTVTLANRAPTGAPPSYQLGPDRFTRSPGDYTAWVLLWGPRGAAQKDGVAESGLVLTQAVTEVAAGATKRVGFETIIPRAVRDGRLQLRLVPQPRLEPVRLDVTLDAPAWQVTGPARWAGAWDRVRTLTWELR